MKLCKVCLNSDFLCKACEKKVKQEELSAEALKLERFIYNLSKKSRIKMPDIENVFSMNHKAIIVTKTPALLIGTKGSLAKKIEKLFGKPVVIIPSNDQETAAKKILGLDVIGINIVYKDGKEILKIRVKKSYKNRLKDLEGLKKMLYSVLKKETIIVFE